MKLSLDKIEYLCRQRNEGIGEMLREAGVSRNAFYSLARKEYVVPRSLVHIAEHLGVSVSTFLDDTRTMAKRMRSLAMEVDRISRRHEESDRDNIRHTLLLLNEKPLERLRRALRRGRFVDLR